MPATKLSGRWKEWQLHAGFCFSPSWTSLVQPSSRPSFANDDFSSNSMLKEA